MPRDEEASEGAARETPTHSHTAKRPKFRRKASLPTQQPLCLVQPKLDIPNRFNRPACCTQGTSVNFVLCGCLIRCGLSHELDRFRALGTSVVFFGVAARVLSFASQLSVPPIVAARDQRTGYRIRGVLGVNDQPKSRTANPFPPCHRCTSLWPMLSCGRRTAPGKPLLTSPR